MCLGRAAQSPHAETGLGFFAALQGFYEDVGEAETQNTMLLRVKGY